MPNSGTEQVRAKRRLGALLHPHAFESPAHSLHLIHESAGFIIDLGPALVARRENLRAFVYLAPSAAPFFRILCHALIVPTLET